MARSDVLCCTSVSDGEGSRKVDSAMGAIGSIKRLHRLSERKPKPAGCPVPHSHRCVQCSLVFLQFLFISEFFFISCITGELAWVLSLGDGKIIP